MRSSKTDDNLVVSLGEMIQSLIKQCVPEGTSLTKLGLKTHFSSYSALSSENVFKLKSMLFSIPFFKHTNGIDTFIITNKRGRDTFYKYSKISMYPENLKNNDVIKEFEGLLRDSSVSESCVEFYYALQMALYFAIYSGDKEITLLVSYLLFLFSKEV